MLQFRRSLLRAALSVAGFARQCPRPHADCLRAGRHHLPARRHPRPNAIKLNTGGVKDQPAKEGWFRQWGEPMVHNVSTATLTPFLPEPGKATGAAVLVAPGGGFRWLSINNEGWKVARPWLTGASRPSC